MFSSGLCILLVVTLSAQGRSIQDEMDNEINANPSTNLGFQDPQEWVKINRPPTPVITKKYGSHVELHCEAMGSPPPTLQWFKRNTRLTENEPNYESNNMISDNPSLGLAKVTSRLVINYLLPRHQDVYRCVAESGAQVTSAATKIIVVNQGGRDMNFTQLIQSKILGAHHVPRITFWSPTYMDVIGSDVVLPCKTVGNPKPKLMWLDNQQQEVKNQDERVQVLQDGELRIRSITWADMGQYHCIVSNMVGQDAVETFLYPMQDSTRK